MIEMHEQENAELPKLPPGYRPRYFATLLTKQRALYLDVLKAQNKMARRVPQADDVTESVASANAVMRDALMHLERCATLYYALESNAKTEKELKESKDKAKAPAQPSSAGGKR